MTFDRNKLRIFNDIISSYAKSGRIKECFHYEHSECEGGIIKSHSITENGILSLIESTVNGQKGIYCFNNTIPNSNSVYGDVKITGKSSASIFQGFCKYHDQNIFKPIENEEYEANSKQLFLHSYRSFAFTFHSQNELWKTYSDVNNRFVPEVL